jgi:hypothetical protein
MISGGSGTHSPSQRKIAMSRMMRQRGASHRLTGIPLKKKMIAMEFMLKYISENEIGHRPKKRRGPAFIYVFIGIKNKEERAIQIGDL